MDLKIIRVFHPIGQGAFYSENHVGRNGDKFNIVYDCGSLTVKGRKLENKIKGSLARGTIIDILFLSHFDEDHVSGVEFLKKHFDVRTVIIPLLEEEAKIYARVSRYLASGSIDNTIVDNPQAFFGDGTKVLFVRSVDFPAEGTISNSDNIPDLPDETAKPADVDSFANGDVMPSGTKISGLNSQTDWCFIPYNYKQAQRAIIFHRLLQEQEIDPAELTDIRNIVKHKKLLNQLYKKVQGSININSMAVYSGPLFANKKVDRFTLAVWRWYHHRELVGSTGGACLYLGDIDLNTPNLINDIWSRIGALDTNLSTLQIPHHGAIGNYDQAILHRNLKHIVISYGTTNSWGHPSDQVVVDCLDHCILSLITEHSNSISVEWIYFQ